MSKHVKDIGGYFELELQAKGDHYHDTPYRLKNGRAALRLILDHIRPSLVYVPYYTCDSLLEPFAVTGIPFQFYNINEQLEPETALQLKEGEYLVYINYFGLKDDAVARLSERYGHKLIADCTQAFFMKGNGVSWYFNSCRKFFGVPDGAYVYTPAFMHLPAVDAPNEKYITDHLLMRLKGQTNEGYGYFVKNEELMDCDTAGMSEMTQQLLAGLDYKAIARIRQENYNYLHTRLKSMNLFNATIAGDTIPMCYPLLLDKPIDKSRLFAGNIFIPTFWKEVMDRSADGFELEKSLTEKLLPLPVDHRYTPEDMERMYASLVKLISQTL